MAEQETEYIGYLKYTGELVNEGLMGARESGEALLGFDSMMRYFMKQEIPYLKKFEFEIPVRVRKGCWEALIPGGLSLLALWLLKEYASATMHKAAQDGFHKIGLVKDLKLAIETSLHAIQWMVKISVHLGKFTKDTLDKIKVKNSGEEVGIPNDKGEYFFVPNKFYKFFKECPEDILSQNAKLVERERILKIGLMGGDEITITEKEKFIFCSKDEKDEILPELDNGDQVDLTGIITIGNEKYNRINLEYEGHSLLCKPQKDKNIADFKTQLVSSEKSQFFSEARVIGVVERTSKTQKPQIIFSKIIRVKNPANSTLL